MNREAKVDLDESLKVLESCLQDLQRKSEEQRRRNAVAPRLEKLEEMIADLGTNRPARPVTCPEEYKALWEEYLAGKPMDLAIGAIRFLAWDPAVATGTRFLELLTQKVPQPTARMLQGLVNSLHQAWPSHDDAEGLRDLADPANRIFKLVAGYQGPNRVVSRWKAASGMLFDAVGPNQFAVDMLENNRTLDDHFKFWFLSPGSRYARAGVRQAVTEWLMQLGKSTLPYQARVSELIFWSGWHPAEFKECVALALLTKSIENTPQLRELLKHSILRDSRLGDPRLPRNANNWLGLSDEARRTFVRWLSADDIEFFFEHVLPAGMDPHGRKDFWLRYIKSIQMSRPLLCDEDRLRLISSAKLRDGDGTPRNFGSIDGTPPTSAFLLDFGDLVIVEFSRTGNAGYVYTRQKVNRVIKDFWSSTPFSSNGLKVRKLAYDRIIHIGAWQDDAANLLAHYGIRPD